MKLYFHPVSTASRPVMLLCAEEKIAHEAIVVDIMTGEHMKPPFSTMNPSMMIPVLEDEGFILTESSAILKYLAEKTGSKTYPKDVKQRARVNERMDWVNANLYREYAYHLVYPQVFPTHKRTGSEAQSSLLSWGKEKTEHWLDVMDKNFLANGKFLCSDICGDQITIADFFCAEVLSCGALISASFKKHPNVDRWMSTMKALPSWNKVNETVDGFAASLKGQQFVTIGA